MAASRMRHAAQGVAFLTTLVLLGYVSIALFRQQFTATKTLTVQSDRAGLLLDTGSAVKMRGVEIGKVSEVRAVGSGAVLTLKVKPGELRNIPADVEAQIVPPTLFGGKYVELAAPTRPEGRIAAGAVITADRVNVEVNAAFTHLIEVLRAADPVRVNGALTALSTALDGKGEEIRTLIGLTDRYLQQINPSLPTIQQDLRRSADVVSTYADLAPNLIRLATSAAKTSDTLVRQQASLNAFLLSITGFANDTGKLLSDNRTRLTTVLDVLDPTTALLARYSSVFPCFFRQAAYVNGKTEPAIGGVLPAINMYSSFLPGQEPYRLPGGLPVVGADDAPSCYEATGAINDGAKIADRHAFNTGTDPYAGYTAGAGVAGTAGGAGAAANTSLLGLLFGLTAVSK